MPKGIYTRTPEIKKKYENFWKSRKGKTYEEIYGKEKAQYLKEKAGLTLKKNPPKSVFKKGHKPSELAKERSKIVNTGKLPWNMGLTKENDKRIKKFSNIKRTADWKNKIRLKAKERWQDLSYREKNIKACLKGLMIRPTSFEKKISELCIENSLPFIYTGDGRFLINFKNPDFVNKNDKIVLEVFYSWFKIRDYGSVENYKEFCKEKYNSAGWKVIFIDENDIDIKNWKEICLNKINNGR